MNNLSFATFCVLCILLALCNNCSAAILPQDVSSFQKHKQSQIPSALNQTASQEQRSGSETNLCLVYRLSGSPSSSNCSFAGCLMRKPTQGLETLTPRIVLIGSDMLCRRSIGSGDAFRLGRVSQSFLCFTTRQESKPLLRRHGACCNDVPLRFGLATACDATCRAGAEVRVRLLRLKHKSSTRYRPQSLSYNPMSGLRNGRSSKVNVSNLTYGLEAEIELYMSADSSASVYIST